MDQIKDRIKQFFSIKNLTLNEFRVKSFNIVILLLAIFLGISLYVDIDGNLTDSYGGIFYWINTGSYFLFLSLPFLKFLKIEQKANILILNMEFAGLVNLFEGGLSGDGRIALFAVPILAAVMTSRRMVKISFWTTLTGFLGIMAHKIIGEGEAASLWISSSGTMIFALSGSVILITNFIKLLEDFLEKHAASEKELTSTLLSFEKEIEDRQRSEKLTKALYKIADFANRSQNLEELYQNVHQVIQDLVHAQNFNIALYDPETEMISFPYWIHEVEPKTKSRKFSNGLTEEVLNMGEPLLLSQAEARAMLEEKKGKLGEVEKRIPASWLGIPLITSENKTIGILALQTYQEEEIYTEQNVDILMFVSAQIAMAIQVKQAVQRQKEINFELEEKVNIRTEQLEAELKEKASIEQDLRRERQLFIDGPVVSIRWDVDNYFTPTYISPNISKFGYEAEKVLSGENNFRDFIHPEDLKKLDKEITEYKVAGVEFYEQDFRIVSPQEEVFWIYDFTSISRNNDGEISGIDTYLLDITERYKFEAALKLKTTQQQELIESAQKLTQDLDVEDVLKRIADGAYKILRAEGCSLYQLEPDGRTLNPLIAIDPEYEDEIMSTKIEVDSSFTGQAVIQKKGMVFNDLPNAGIGAQIPGTPVETNEKLISVPFIIEDRILGAMTINRFNLDFSSNELGLAETFAAYAASAINAANQLESLEKEIEERKRIESQLDMQSNALQATNSPIIITDPEGDIDWVNPAFTKLTGYELGEVRGRNMSMLKSGKHDYGFYEHLWDTILSGQVWQGEIINKSKMGRFYTVETTINPVWSDDRGNINHFVAIQQDISEKKQQERERNAFIQVAADLRNAANTLEMSPIILDNLMDLLNVKAAAHVVVDPARKQLLVQLGKGKWSHWNGIELPFNQGIPGKVITTKDWYMSNNVQDDPDVCDNLPLMKNLYHQICTPLIIEGQVSGLLWVGNDVAFTYDEAKILMTISEMASNALGRAFQHEETQLRVERLNALRKVDMAIAGSNEMDLALNVVAEQALSNLGVDAASVLVLDPQTQSFQYKANVGFDTSGKLSMNAGFEEGLCGYVVKKSDMVSILDLNFTKLDIKRKWLLETERFVTYFGLPLIAKGELQGVLEVFTRKRFQPPESWVDFLKTLAGQTAIAIDNSLLFSNLQQSNVNLELAYDTTLVGWAKALELRDFETKGHSERVIDLAIRLAEKLQLNGDEFTHLRRGAILHDIGKMGIPDSILLKPGPLEPEEWEIVKMHPQYGLEMLKPIPFLANSIDLVLFHHERWDGGGYPQGLSEFDIPHLARLFSIVDVYDALTHARPYKKAWSHADSIAYIEENAGKQFDPYMVEAFTDIIRQ